MVRSCAVEAHHKSLKGPAIAASPWRLASRLSHWPRLSWCGPLRGPDNVYGLRPRHMHTGALGVGLGQSRGGRLGLFRRPSPPEGFEGDLRQGLRARAALGLGYWWSGFSVACARGSVPKMVGCRSAAAPSPRWWRHLRGARLPLPAIVGGLLLELLFLAALLLLELLFLAALLSPLAALLLLSHMCCLMTCQDTRQSW